MRVITHRAIQEFNLTAPALQFVDQQTLVDVLASQTIRGRDQNQLKRAQRRMIAQMIQARAIQRGPAITVIAVDVLLSQMPLRLSRNLDTQTAQLLFNRLRLLLATGRDPNVQGDLHGNPPEGGMVQVQHLRDSPSPNAEGTGRRNPSVVDHHCGLPLNDSRAIANACFLPRGDPNLLGGYYSQSGDCLPQPQGPPPPRQFERPPPAQAEFVICDYPIEFNFRDAKQFWGLEDFMNVTPTAVTNAANLSLFMVDLSQPLLDQLRAVDPAGSILDLKAFYRGAKYVAEAIEMLPQKPEPLLLARIFDRLAALGRIHIGQLALNSP